MVMNDNNDDNDNADNDDTYASNENNDDNDHADNHDYHDNNDNNDQNSTLNPKPCNEGFCFPGLAPFPRMAFQWLKEMASSSLRPRFWV